MGAPVGHLLIFLTAGMICPTAAKEGPRGCVSETAPSINCASAHSRAQMRHRLPGLRRPA